MDSKEKTCQKRDMRIFEKLFPQKVKGDNCESIKDERY
jgi:hypothetical protein